MRTDRPYDIVVMGATGYTGRLVAEYLLEHGPAELRWALAGRSRDKLAEVRTELATRQARAEQLPLIVADSLDRDAMTDLARQTTVVCTTVGPYLSYGEPLVAACAAEGTHYLDLTGEVLFIRRMIDAHEAAAAKSGARIVHCCGFDSIPSDLGVFMLGAAMRERGATLKQVRMFAGESRGRFSGGTAASFLTIIEQISQDPSLRKVVGHPYALNPPDDRKGPDRGDQTTVIFDRELGMWTAPFLMAPINTRVVRRTQHLRGHPYGRDFKYSEAMSTGKGFKGWMRATSLVAGLGVFLAAALNGRLRGLIADRVLPKPGQGPTRQEREEGYFVIRMLATGETSSGTQLKLRGRIRGEKDPGYGETAKMMGEAAMCLALDGPHPGPGGILTPASAMGAPLLARLRAARMTFEVKDG